LCQFFREDSKSTGSYINIKALETAIPVEFAEPGDYPECSRENVLIVWDGARSGLTGRGVSGYIGSMLSKIWSEIIDNGYLYYFLCSQYNYINTNTKGVISKRLRGNHSNSMIALLFGLKSVRSH